jgi:hypothetical protein
VASRAGIHHQGGAITIARSLGTAAAIIALAAAPTLAAPEPSTGLDLPSGLVIVAIPPDIRPALCGFTIGGGAIRLTWVEDRTVVTETARSFATVAAARRVLLANRARLATCRIIRVDGLAMRVRPKSLPRVADQGFAGNVMAGGYVVGDIVFLRRGRSIAVLTWMPSHGDLLTTARLARAAARQIVP